MSNSRSADEYRSIVKQAQTEGKLLVTKFFTEDCYVSGVHSQTVSKGRELREGAKKYPASNVLCSETPSALMSLSSPHEN
jgi:hypothetical protein